MMDVHPIPFPFRPLPVACADVEISVISELDVSPNYLVGLLCAYYARFHVWHAYFQLASRMWVSKAVAIWCDHMHYSRTIFGAYHVLSCGFLISRYFLSFLFIPPIRCFSSLLYVVAIPVFYLFVLGIFEFVFIFTPQVVVFISLMVSPPALFDLGRLVSPPFVICVTA